jgi:hypothetical protein
LSELGSYVFSSPYLIFGLPLRCWPVKYMDTQLQNNDSVRGLPYSRPFHTSVLGIRIIWIRSSYWVWVG